MTPTHTPASVCVTPRREEIAARAIAYLRTLGPGAELATASMAVALDVRRAVLVASLMPIHASGLLWCRGGYPDGRVTWRLGVPAPYAADVA